ncbi:ribose 5-phosphate isomerase B [Vagococcus fluvialis]|uniref:ribose 5-phosphate isomerase B n=1 Tax=Vagococcus fluvialis TaxID=2738 RepID=UPI003D0B85D7
MKIAIANDHGGIELKKTLVDYFEEHEVSYVDFGVSTSESVDYPSYAKTVCEEVLADEDTLGILCCGTGIGMSIAANKVKGIRAAVVGDVFSAKATREHNHSNVLCLGERVTGPGLALLITETWLNATPLDGRHQNRVNQLEKN